ncbi:helix-turn-helix domain-containing protein [Actinocrispum sp. NPDC049592]|uniref:winged helix-turn-helix transcriptional regulator n=1 Tax=Actinocrispum sp. NPDC049592 TaxID=3154835 RepID=UPI003442622E
MRTYGQYCPIVRAVEVLGDRWTLLIVRDMLIGATRFNEIARGLPGLSRALLSRRLRQLHNDGLIERSADGYTLTEAGEQLRPIVFGLADWGARYAFGDPRPEELDPEVLMWWMHGQVDTSQVRKRSVIQVEVADRRRTFWLVLEPGEASVCNYDPGFDIDAVLKSDLRTLYQMWEGEIELNEGLRAGTISLTGTRTAIRALPGMLGFSPVAPLVRAARHS